MGNTDKSREKADEGMSYHRDFNLFTGWRKHDRNTNIQQPLAIDFYRDRNGAARGSFWPPMRYRKALRNADRRRAILESRRQKMRNNEQHYRYPNHGQHEAPPPSPPTPAPSPPPQEQQRGTLAIDKPIWDEYKSNRLEKPNDRRFKKLEDGGAAQKARLLQVAMIRHVLETEAIDWCIPDPGFRRSLEGFAECNSNAVLGAIWTCILLTTKERKGEDAMHEQKLDAAVAAAKVCEMEIAHARQILKVVMKWDEDEHSDTKDEQSTTAGKGSSVGPSTSRQPASTSNKTTATMPPSTASQAPATGVAAAATSPTTPCPGGIEDPADALSRRPDQESRSSTHQKPVRRSHAHQKAAPQPATLQRAQEDADLSLFKSTSRGEELSQSIDATRSVYEDAVGEFAIALRDWKAAGKPTGKGKKPARQARVGNDNGDENEDA